MYCGKCGKEISEGQTICEDCTNKLKTNNNENGKSTIKKSVKIALIIILAIILLSVIITIINMSNATLKKDNDIIENKENEQQTKEDEEEQAKSIEEQREAIFLQINYNINKLNYSTIDIKFKDGTAIPEQLLEISEYNNQLEWAYRYRATLYDVDSNLKLIKKDEYPNVVSVEEAIVKFKWIGNKFNYKTFENEEYVKKIQEEKYQIYKEHFEDLSNVSETFKDSYSISKINKITVDVKFFDKDIRTVEKVLIVYNVSCFEWAVYGLKESKMDEYEVDYIKYAYGEPYEDYIVYQIYNTYNSYGELYATDSYSGKVNEYNSSIKTVDDLYKYLDWHGYKIGNN